MRRGAVLACAALVASAVAVAAATSHAADAAEPIDRARDRVRARAEIATPAGPHGEVRVLRRGRSAVVQTLLHTKLLRRAIGEIRKRELAGWPEGSPERAASLRYLAALARAESQLPRPGTGAGTDRRRALLIEFALWPAGESVTLFAPRVAESGEGLAIEDARAIDVLELPRSFVRGDMLRIVGEHFPELDAEALLELDAPGDSSSVSTPRRLRLRSARGSAALDPSREPARPAARGPAA